MPSMDEIAAAMAAQRRIEEQRADRLDATPQAREGREATRRTGDGGSGARKGQKAADLAAPHRHATPAFGPGADGQSLQRAFTTSGVRTVLSSAASVRSAEGRRA